jgi:hypothetical protein
MQCSQCGAENVANAQFCESCGSPIAATEPYGQPVSAAQQPLYPPQADYGQQVAAPAAYPPQQTYPTQQPYPPQQAYPPQQVYAPQPGQVMPPPPKKKRGCLVVTLIIIGVLLLGCAGVAFAMTQLFKPKDLGVSYTEADYQSAVTKLGIQVTDTVPNLPVAQTKIVYKGKKKVNVKLSSSEVSAAVSMHHRSPNWALSDVQILLGVNNQAQMSGYAVYNGQRYPFTADITAMLAGPQSVTGSASNIVVFGVDFPQEYYGAASAYLIGATNDWLAGMGDGLDIQTATITNGQLVLSGTVPASAERVPLTGTGGSQGASGTSG